jgi:hypothetical protein
MLLGLKLLFSGAFDALLRGVSAALKWLLADWRNAVVGTVLPAFMWMALVTAPGLRDEIAERDRKIVRVNLDLVAERSAHLGTVNTFLEASRQAQKDAEANALRVAREQEIITDASVANYRRDLAALRARAGRLRARDAARTDPGHADAADLPGLSGPAARADAAPGEDRLPAAGELSASDALIASEQALQLDALIDWIEAQQTVRFNPEPAQ